jgi:hypothetical protein
MKVSEFAQKAVKIINIKLEETKMSAACKDSYKGCLATMTGLLDDDREYEKVSAQPFKMADVEVNSLSSAVDIHHTVENIAKSPFDTLNCFLHENDAVKAISEFSIETVLLSAREDNDFSLLSKDLLNRIEDKSPVELSELVSLGRLGNYQEKGMFTDANDASNPIIHEDAHKSTYDLGVIPASLPKFDDRFLEKTSKDPNRVLFAEDLLNVSMRLANFSQKEADDFRIAAMKDNAAFLQMSEKFLAGCAKNNVSEDVANSALDNIKSFSIVDKGYGFHKSEAVMDMAYSTLTADTRRLMDAMSMAKEPDGIKSLTDLMQVYTELGHFTMAEADVFRKVVSKGDVKKVKSMSADFFVKCLASDIPEEVATSALANIKSFSTRDGYQFARSEAKPSVDATKPKGLK